MAKQDYFLCPIDDLVPDPSQPRQNFAEDDLVALSKSISEKGVLLPIIVRPTEGSRFYEIVAGERRWRASKLCGLTNVPVLVRELSSKAAFELAVIENTQRADLNPIEEALAFKRLLTEHEMPQTEVAELVGRSRVYVANSIRLLDLEDHHQRALVEGKLNARQARILMTVSKGELREQLASLLEKGMGTAEAEAWSRKMQSRETGKHKPNRLKGSPPYAKLTELAKETLERYFPDNQVSLSLSGRSGEVSIKFQSLHGLCLLLTRLSK
jgi:ParB family chromosome partitioning protein